MSSTIDSTIPRRKKEKIKMVSIAFTWVWQIGWAHHFNLRPLPRWLVLPQPFSCSSSSRVPLVHHRMAMLEQNQCASESQGEQ